MTGLPLLPTVAVEFVGSALAIVLSFTALGYARMLVKLQPNNFIWGFLWYFCIAMAAFSLSRGVGHIVRISLVYSGRSATWQQLSPWSGGFNTMLMISVAAVIIYYHKGLAAYRAIRVEAEKLADANTRLAASAEELQRLNTDLEARVEERTSDLSKSEKKFRNFFENSKDIVFFCDAGGNITDINTSGTRMLGFTQPQERCNFHALFCDPLVLATFLKEIREKGFVSDLEIECCRQNGSLRHILLSANAIFDQRGELAGYEGIGKDMTRVHTMTQQLINQEKMASVGQMAAGVAHEINTPLGIILGYTQLMMDDFGRESETWANMQVIERQTKACRRIVADLLKFSRQAKSVKASINLNEIIEDVLAVTEHTLNINAIAVERHFDPRLPEVFGDPEKLHQVFINLFNNSQYAMAGGGIIAISTEHRAGGPVRVTVRDTGSGIAEDMQNRIFDPFFTTKEVGKGTGLGLSVSYGIIEEHGGSISVQSPVADPSDENKRPGTAFHIELPALEADTEPDLNIRAGR